MRMFVLRCLSAVALFLFAGSPFALETPIARYLMPIQISKNGSGLEGIDCIYVINLDTRPKKWKKMSKILQKHELHGNRVSAINGWNLSTKIQAELAGPYPIRLRGGAIGCLLSHLSVIQDAYHRGFERIWVMEDDVKLIGEKSQISNLVENLSNIDPDWDLFYTDDNSKNREGYPLESIHGDFRPDGKYDPIEQYLKRTKVSENLLRIRQRFGMYSVIISRKGMKKILDYFTHTYLWSSLDIDIHYIPHLNEYATTTDLVTINHKVCISDTENRMSLYNSFISFFQSKISGFSIKRFIDKWENYKEKTVCKSKSLPGWCSREKAFLIMDIIQKERCQEVVEIGVFGGASLFPMLKAVQYLRHGTVYGIDPWNQEEATQGFPSSDSNYAWWSQCDFSSIYEGFCRLIQENDFGHCCKIFRQPAQIAVLQFADQTIDFIHFDGNHSEKCAFEDVVSFFPKVKDGGYILLNNPTWLTKRKPLVFLLERAELISEFTPSAPYFLFKKDIQREKNAQSLFE